MANMTRFDPFNDLVDDLFKGYFMRPVAYNGRNTPESLRLKVDVTEKIGAEGVRVLHTERTFGKVSRSFSLPKKAAAARKSITIQ